MRHIGFTARVGKPGNIPPLSRKDLERSAVAHFPNLRSRSGALFVLTALLACAFCNAATAAPPRPNVVIFFVDDAAYADLGCYGSRRNQTPNIDRLAKEGIKFTNFYNGWTACSPSRSSLLTGCYAERVGMGGSVCFPHLDKALQPSEYTMAEMFKDAGYVAGCFGKWHLGHRPGYLPPSQGFDEYWGIPYSNDMWCPEGMGASNSRRYPPLPFIHNEEVVALVTRAEDQALLTQAFTDAALAFVRKNHDKPFFAYIPYSAVHGPVFGHPDFMKHGKNPYQAQTEEIDAAVGKMAELLKELKIDRKTLIIVMSDNGGAGGEKGPLRGGKAEPVYEGHMRTYCVTWWPGQIPAGVVNHQIGVTIDWMPTLAKLCGGKLSDNKIDGKDISGLLLDPENAKSPHEVVRYKASGWRRGNWKIVQNGRAQLYDLEKDLGEKNDVSAEHPDVVKQLESEKEAWLKSLRNEVRPHAKMDPTGPLVTWEQAKDYPRLADWIKQQK